MNLTEEEIKKYLAMANAIRFLSADAVENAKSGHPGMPMGVAEVVTILFAKHLKFNPENPEWKNRDRFILSAGHGSMLIYSLLYLLGYPKISMDHIKSFRKVNSPAAGHPEFGELPGIETTTGPLGQGLGNGLGMAISEKIMRQRYGENVFNHYTYILAGDGCLMEGISHEFASLAGHLNLSNLVLIYDDNKISIDGPTSLTMSDNTLERFNALGWHTTSIDGYNLEEVDSALTNAKLDPRPSLISCQTLIGYGAPNKQNTAGSHGAPLGEEEIQMAKKNMKWNYDKFVLPEQVKKDWEEIGNRNIELSKEWEKQNSLTINNIKKINDELLNNIERGKKESINYFLKNKENIATRKSSEIVLEFMNKYNLNLLGGSADLTGSNNTFVKSMHKITKTDFKGNYIHWGVREHCMAAAMNGIALHGFLIPYGGTFLVFSDYCRPSIRLSALMKKRVIYVFTHDSIGLGEDGPTHQPIEHLSSLRDIPNLKVFRPCDSIETAECWALALANKDGPSVLALSRQNLKLLRNEKFNNEENYSNYGAYIILDFETTDINIIASGSEVEIAVEASKKLNEINVKARVISMPCMELCNENNMEYRKTIFNDTKNIFIEAGTMQSWAQYMNSEDVFIGLKSFGLSGPAKDVYEHFQITVERVIKEVTKVLNI